MSMESSSNQFNLIYVENDRKQYLELLLLADEQESMIDKYISEGDMYVLHIGETAAGVVVVVKCSDAVIEIKNLAVVPEYQKQGLGRSLIEFVERTYKNSFSKLIVGTGDSPMTVPFYERCGFERSHVLEKFFVDNYDHPIFECGVQLIDMIYLSKRL